MQTVHFTAEELLTGQFSSWAEIQCSSPSPSGLQEHSSMRNRIHPDCSRLGQQIFLQLLDRTETNKHGNHFTILNQRKMLRWTSLNRTNYHDDGVQLQEMIEWIFNGFICWWYTLVFFLFLFYLFGTLSLWHCFSLKKHYMCLVYSNSVLVASQMHFEFFLFFFLPQLSDNLCYQLCSL